MPTNASAPAVRPTDTLKSMRQGTIINHNRPCHHCHTFICEKTSTGTCNFYQYPVSSPDGNHSTISLLSPSILWGAATGSPLFFSTPLPTPKSGRNRAQPIHPRSLACRHAQLDFLLGRDLQSRPLFRRSATSLPQPAKPTDTPVCSANDRLSFLQSAARIAPPEDPTVRVHQRSRRRTARGEL